jgi:hypothetical protein
MTNAKKRFLKNTTITTGKLSEAIKVNTLAGRKADVVLIDEGLGNRVNMNYYGPEAIDGAPIVFEGAPCFTDHPSESEAEDRPERSVWHKAGYFTNVRVESVNGKKAAKATITLDETEAGEMVLEKIKAAVKFKEDNPAADHEYVGLSINAQGETEKRDMTVEGEKLSVNYVTNFVKDPFTSVDIVTTPARGGRFLALLESISGARKNKQEANIMNEAMKKLVAKLNEAAKVKTPEELKVIMSGIMKEAEQIEDEAKKEEEAKKKEGEDGENADAFKKLKAEHEALLKKHEDIGGMVKDLHKALHGENPELGKDKEEAKKEDEDKDEDMSAEESVKATRLVSLMLKEAAIPAEMIDAVKLAKKPIKAIEAEIARNKKIIELSTGSTGKTKEAAKAEVMLNDQFSGLSKI